MVLGQQWVPSLQGRIGAPAPNELSPTAGNTELLADLIDSLRSAHPEAGRHYWAARSWSLLTWQPVSLCIGAAMTCNKRFPTEHLSQQTSACLVAGYSLQTDRFESAAEDKVIEQSAQYLRRYADILLEALTEQIRISPTLALRLLADRCLSILLLLQKQMGLAPDAIELLGQRWLHGLGVENYSAMMTVPLANGRQQLALNRKGCCQDYRRADGQLCSTCPRQKMPLRIQRLQQEFQINV